jgi:parvulin-like peptidyl-prolyl isomerase
MIKSINIAGLLILIGISGFAGNERSNHYLAQIGSRQISSEDFVTRYTEYLQQTGLTDNIKLRHDFFNVLVNEAVLLEFASNNHLSEEPLLKSRLKNREEQLYLDYYYEKYLYPQLIVTESETREAFRRSNIKIHARHLYARTLEEAYSIKKQLAEGRTFESIASEIFTDPILSSNGGDLGWFSYDEMDPNFEDAVYSMQIGEISDPVKTNDGYSIIEVLEREMKPFITEDQYKQNEKWLKLQVKRRKHTRFVEAKTDEILRKTQLQFNDKNLRLFIAHFPEVREQIFTNSDLTEIDLDPINEILLSTKNGQWTIRHTINKMFELNKIQWARIRSDDDIVKAIKGLVIREEIERQIAEKNVKNQLEVKRLINQEKDNVTLTYIAERFLDTLSFNDDILRKHYQENLDKFLSPKQFEIAEIALKDSVIAKEIRNRLSNGESFANLAANFSTNQRSSTRGGYLGWGEKDQFGILSKYIANAHKDDVIGPLQYYDSYYIIKIINIKEPSQISFEQSKNKIKMSVKQEMFKDKYLEFINIIKSNLILNISSGKIDELNINVKRGRL